MSLSQDISLKTKHVNVMGALQEKSGDHQSYEDSSSGDHELDHVLTL